MKFYVKADGKLRVFDSDCSQTVGQIEMMKVDVALALTEMGAKKFGPILCVIK